MTKRLSTAFSAALAMSVLIAADSFAQVTRIDLQVVESPTFNGENFGQVGQYELLRGVVYGEADPADPRHREIVNLENAPRNERGRVEYSTTIEIYRPTEMDRWNRALYHTVPNRGQSRAPEPALLERGFALVMVGWQGDLTPTDNNIVPSLPVARHAGGSPIVGRAMEEGIFNDADPVSHIRLTYEAASLDPGDATLTVRRSQTAARRTPDDLRWHYVDARQIRIERPTGFGGGAIYEFIYDAKEPIVMGLGFVAMRDAISFLRYDATDTLGSPNPLSFDGLASTAISLGISQSGRYLRDFLYQGFNEDVSGQIVFDGMHPDIAGSRKTFTNYAFSQPGRMQAQHEDHLYPGDQFPFSYATLTDPISGRTDGLLEKCSASSTCPKIVHTDSETEIWQARSSLLVTDALGRDIELPESVRVYIVAGTQHGGGQGVHLATPSRGNCQYLRNPLGYRQIRVALTVALYEWVVEGVEPPASRFPSVVEGGLVPATDNGFPHIPGVIYSGSYNPLRLHDHETVPPKQGDPYTVLVGRVDRDGNMIDGVRPPNLSVPIGTHMGWNLWGEDLVERAQCRTTGSFIPFATDRAEREAAGDPRASLEERYPSHEEYVSAVSQAAEALVRDRLLLPRDAKEIVDLARGSEIGRD